MTETTAFVKNTGKVTEQLLENLIKCQKKLTHAPKKGANPFFNSDYVPYEALRDHVEAIYSEHKIYIHQVSHRCEKGVGIETIFVGHGGAISNGIVEIPAPKNDPHGYGSAQTYAKRYSLALACGIGGEKDDDGNANSKDPRIKNALDKQFKDPVKQLDNLGKSVQKDQDPIKVMANGKVRTTLALRSYVPYMKQYAGDPSNADHRKMFTENELQIVAVDELKDVVEAHREFMSDGE